MGFFKVNSWKDVFIHLGIMILLTFIVGYIILNVWLPSYTKHGQEIEVPLIEKMSPKEAKEVLKEKNLRLEIQDTIYKPKYKPGTIIKQEPKAKSNVKENRRIYVSINSLTIPTDTITKEMIEEMTAHGKTSVISAITKYNFEVGEPLLNRNTPYKDYVPNVLYHGDTLKVGMVIPIGAKIDMSVNDGKGQDKYIDDSDSTSSTIEDSDEDI